MDATLIETDAGDTSSDRGSATFGAGPNRGPGAAVLARSAAILDAMLRAILSADAGGAPLTRRQRGVAGGAVLASVAGAGGLVAMATLKPDLGASEPAALVGSIGATILPLLVAICGAVMGAERRAAQRAAASPSAASRTGPTRRWGSEHRSPDRPAIGREEQQARAVARARAEIAERERRLSERIAATGSEPRSSGGGPVARSRLTEPPAAAAGALPADVVEALADLEARERVQVEEAAAARRTAASSPARALAGAARLAAAARPNARRHARITPRNTRTFITTEDGRKLHAVITDVSQSGVAIEGNLPGLWVGSMVTVGSRRAKAVRVLSRGMAFEFSLPVAAEALTPDLIL